MGFELGLADIVSRSTYDSPVELTVAKLDAIWFAPEKVTYNKAKGFTNAEGNAVARDFKPHMNAQDGEVALILHNVPFTKALTAIPSTVQRPVYGAVKGLLRSAKAPVTAIGFETITPQTLLVRLGK